MNRSGKITARELKFADLRFGEPCQQFYELGVVAIILYRRIKKDPCQITTLCWVFCFVIRNEQFLRGVLTWSRIFRCFFTGVVVFWCFFACFC